MRRRAVVDVVGCGVVAAVPARRGGEAGALGAAGGGCNKSGYGKR